MPSGIVEHSGSLPDGIVVCIPYTKFWTTYMMIWPAVLSNIHTHSLIVSSFGVCRTLNSGQYTRWSYQRYCRTFRPTGWWCRRLVHSVPMLNSGQYTWRSSGYTSMITKSAKSTATVYPYGIVTWSTQI